MTANCRLLFTIACLLSCITGLKAQEAAYDYKIIAILPFKTMSYKGPSQGSDSAVQRLIAHEVARSFEIQEAFYNAITSDTERLLVDVQDWKLTDSLLKAAGFDFRKVNFSDKQVLAALLKVDAVLTGELVSHRASGSAVDNATVAAAGGAWALVGMLDRPKKMTVFLYDGKTGDPLWNFERELTGNPLFNRDKNLDERLFKAFIRKFPYTR